MQLVAPKTGADRERWLSSVYSMAPTPPALTGVPNQSFQGMDFQPAPGYQPQPQGFPLFGGLAATSSPYQSRIDTLQSRNDGLMGQMQDVRNKITGQLGQFQDMVSQPVQPFQMPQQHQVDPTSAKLGAVAAVLAILGGAHGQAANQAYGGFIQGQQQRADQETQRDTQQAMYDYQAGQQARQGKLQGVMAGVQKYENVLQGLGAEFNQGERQITSLVDQQERDKTRREIADQTEAGRAAMRELTRLKIDASDPAKKMDRLAQWALDHPEIPNAYELAFSGQIKDLSTAAQQTANANRTNRTLELQIEALTKSNTLKGLNIDKMRKDLENYDDDRAARLAETWARIDDMHFRQEHYGDTFDSKVIDSEENMLKADEDNFNKFIKEKNDYIQELDNKIALQDPKVSKDYIAALETLKSDAIRARDLAFSEVTRAIFERRQKIKDMRSAIAARAKSSVPPKPPLPKAKTSRSGRPPSLPGEVPPADPTKVIPRNPSYPPDRRGK